MAWARVDDGWWAHPKVMGLSLAARGLWVSALSWSCHQRKEIVPSGFLLMVGGQPDDADELCGAGLWVPIEGGWRIHDWAEYQEKSLSEKRAESGAKGGRASGKARRSKPRSEANRKQTAVASEGTSEAGPTRPDPTHPDPSIATGCTEKDRQTDETHSPSVHDALEATAETFAALRWSAALRAGKVDPSKRSGWVRATAAGVLRERSGEIVGLLAEGLEPEEVAARMDGPVLMLVQGAVDRPLCEACDGVSLVESEAGWVQCPECAGSWKQARSV